MSKSKYGDSNLYMTTREFADLVINVLDDQDYFKKDRVAHPQDIANAFVTVGETVGEALSWAITQESMIKKKEAVMKTDDLKKSDSVDDYNEKTWRGFTLGDSDE